MLFFSKDDLYEYFLSIANNEKVCEFLLTVIVGNFLLEDINTAKCLMNDLFLKAISEVNEKLYKKFVMLLKLDGRFAELL